MSGIRKIGIVCLTAILLLAVLPMLPAGAGVGADAMNYGKGEEYDVTLTPDELFSLLFPDDVGMTDVEAAYLRTDPSLFLTYFSGIPDSVVDTVYDGDAGTLTVTVPPYRYTASNGVTVVWTPQTVALEDEAPADLVADGEVWRHVYSDIWHSGEFDLTVRFGWSVTVPAGTADRLRTLPRTVAEKVCARQDAYRAATEAWTAQSEAYSAYLAAVADHQASVSAYAQYLADLADYLERKAARDRYVAEKAAYDAKVAAFEPIRAEVEAYEAQLAAYYQYEAVRQGMEGDFDRYEHYLNGLNAAKDRLAVIESMFLTESHGWRFYSGLMGSAVDSVLNNRKGLATLNVDMRLVDAADEATIELRALMEGYSDLRGAAYSSDFERTGALFAYYAEHYEAIRNNLVKLYENILAIFQYKVVRDAVLADPDARARMPHFRQFLAHMYVLAKCMDDSSTLDPAWTFPQETTGLAELLDEELYLTDTDSAAPSGVTFPEAEVILGEGLPEPVIKPENPHPEFTEDQDPRRLTVPTWVAPAGKEPAAVAEPGEEPAAVAQPGQAPEEPTFSGEECALAQALRDGSLPERPATGEDRILSLTRSVTARRSVDNRKTVTFYGVSDERIATYYIEYGGELTESPSASREADESYTYRFLGWVPKDDQQSAPVSLAGITSDLSLSPLFEKIPRAYSVTWVIGTRKQVDFYRYGETPVPPEDTSRTPEDGTVCTFVGWDSEPQKVTADATYTAQYSVSARICTVTWDLGYKTVTEEIAYGEIPAYTGSTERAPDENLYSFRGWDRALTRATSDATYRAVWQITPLLRSSDGTVCAVEHGDESITLYPTEDQFDITTVMDYAKSTEQTVILRRENVELSFNRKTQDALTEALCSVLEFRVTGTAEEGTTFRVLCRNNLGKELKASLSVQVAILYPAESDVYPVVYRIGSTGTLYEVNMTRYSGGRSSFAVRVGDEFISRPEYELRYVDESGNSNTAMLPSHAVAGETVSLAADCAYGYEVSGATLVYADGTRQEVGPVFEMPEKPVRVLLNVTQIVYHVTFVSDGTVLSEQDRSFGEEIVLPSDPVKEADDTYSYAFTGWSPYVSRATGEDRSPVYTATYSRTLLDPEGSVEVDPWAFFRSPQFLVPVCFAAVVLLLSVILIARAARHRKRRRRRL